MLSYAVIVRYRYSKIYISTCWRYQEEGKQQSALWMEQSSRTAISEKHFPENDYLQLLKVNQPPLSLVRGNSISLLTLFLMIFPLAALIGRMG